MPWLFDFLMRGILAKGWISLDRGCRGTWKVSDYTEGGERISQGTALQRRKVGYIFVLVMSIARWNQMRIGSAPWNNEPITVY